MLRTIVGKRGTGKTSLIAELIASENYDQVFIFDYLRDYNEFQLDWIHIAYTGFRSFCHYVWDNSTMGIKTLLVLDEVALYGKNSPQVDHFYRMGRHKAIDMIATSQRIFSLPVIVRSQTDTFSIFNVTEVNDVKYLKNYVSEKVLSIIMTLRKFNYINIHLSLE